ncbi:hypothetical protein F3Y22_tig00117048pilonHSYRG00218 [Hibiscus syriacus]|uniref:Uncharacterized protein n=1 Tax=Hibiscus syriacus TaxID=106335 RepID=A0A6A2WAA1_HIBSY|nr:hypothetical protein F3Y22_tig00117048pilonHSYRG00218 [Hibiscus syriacus]
MGINLIDGAEEKEEEEAEDKRNDPDAEADPRKAVAMGKEDEDEGVPSTGDGAAAIGGGQVRSNTCARWALAQGNMFEGGITLNIQVDEGSSNYKYTLNVGLRPFPGADLRTCRVRESVTVKEGLAPLNRPFVGHRVQPYKLALDHRSRTILGTFEYTCLASSTKPRPMGTNTAVDRAI